MGKRDLKTEDIWEWIIAKNNVRECIMTGMWVHGRKGWGVIEFVRQVIFSQGGGFFR